MAEAAGPRGAVYSVAVSDDGALIAVGSWEGWVALYDRAGKCVWSFTTGGQVWSTGISGDGRYLVAGSSDGNLYVFRWSDRLYGRFQSGGPVRGAAISSSGRHVACGGEAGIIVWYDRVRGRPLWKAQAGCPVYSLALSANGFRGVAGCGDGHIILYQGGKERWRYQTGAQVWGASVSHSGHFLAAASGDENLYFFDSTGRLLWKHFMESRVWSVSMTANGEMVVAATDAGKLYCFRGRSGKLLWHHDTGSSGNGVLATAISRLGEHIVCCTSARRIVCFENRRWMARHALQSASAVLSVAKREGGNVAAAEELIRQGEAAIRGGDNETASKRAVEAESALLGLHLARTVSEFQLRTWLIALGIMEDNRALPPALAESLSPLYIRHRELIGDTAIEDRLHSYDERLNLFRGLLKNYEHLSLRENRATEEMAGRVKAGIASLSSTIERLREMLEERERTLGELEDRVRLVYVDWLSAPHRPPRSTDALREIEQKEQALRNEFADILEEAATQFDGQAPAGETRMELLFTVEAGGPGPAKEAGPVEWVPALSDRELEGEMDVKEGETELTGLKVRPPRPGDGTG